MGGKGRFSGALHPSNSLQALPEGHDNRSLCLARWKQVRWGLERLAERHKEEEKKARKEQEAREEEERRKHEAQRKDRHAKQLEFLAKQAALAEQARQKEQE